MLDEYSTDAGLDGAALPSAIREALPPNWRAILEERLSPEHLAYLRTSGILDEVIYERGYRTITNPLELLALGFKLYQCRRGILIPQWNVHGESAGYQLRPDVPRRNRKAKSIKYESPAASRKALDVHSRCRPMLTDPAIPLGVTEGSKKADAAASRGLCCVSISGVWAWRGRNESGGLTALACWDSIALNGRNVVIAFDSDVMSNPKVYRALIRLQRYLESRGAFVRFVDWDRIRQ
jgi:hypothetical protein